MNHTPGPWFVVPYYSNGCESCPTVRAGTSPISTKIVAECHGAPYLGFSETNPNARLIAAAPDLLEAAKALLDVIAEPNAIVQDHLMDNALQAMADAIARATEGQP